MVCRRLLLILAAVLIFNSTVLSGIAQKGVCNGSRLTAHDAGSNSLLEYPWGPPVVVTFDVFPSRLNLESNNKWAIGVVKLPAGFRPIDVNVSSVLINDTIPVDLSQLMIIGSDYLMLKFKQTEISGYVLAKGITFGDLIFQVNGRFDNETLLEGTAVVKVTMGGDVNFDGKVDLLDAISASGVFGSTTSSSDWTPTTGADQNGDGVIDVFDVILIARNFGKSYL